MAEQSDGKAGRALCPENGQSGEEVVGLILDPRFQPASARAADAALVERAPRDPPLRGGAP